MCAAAVWLWIGISENAVVQNISLKQVAVLKTSYSFVNIHYIITMLN